MPEKFGKKKKSKSKTKYHDQFFSHTSEIFCVIFFRLGMNIFYTLSQGMGNCMKDLFFTDRHKNKL